MNELTFLPFERVLIHTYDGERWNKVSGEIALESKAFAQGSFRSAYRAKLIKGVPVGSGENTNEQHQQHQQQQQQLYVCKFAMDSETPKQLYLHDVEAQVYAARWAEQFNLRGPRIPVYFVDAFVIEFVERAGRPYAGCELYINGEFQKHNNNVGSVSTEGGNAAAIASNSPLGATDVENAFGLSLDEFGLGPIHTSQVMSAAACSSHVDIANISKQDVIDTANAFSHFTYYASQKQILICDIQGVGGTYTDPQVHTLQTGVFGVGNLGYTGIRAFLLRHVCTRMCSTVNLPRISPKDLAERPEELSILPVPQSAPNNLGGSPALVSTPGLAPVSLLSSIKPPNQDVFRNGKKTVNTTAGRLDNLVDSILNENDDFEYITSARSMRKKNIPSTRSTPDIQSTDALLSQLELLDLVTNNDPIPAAHFAPTLISHRVSPMVRSDQQREKLNESLLNDGEAEKQKDNAVSDVSKFDDEDFDADNEVYSKKLRARGSAKVTKTSPACSYTSAPRGMFSSNSPSQLTRQTDQLRSTTMSKLEGYGSKLDAADEDLVDSILNGL